MGLLSSCDLHGSVRLSAFGLYPLVELERGSAAAVNSDAGLNPGATIAPLLPKAAQHTPPEHANGAEQPSQQQHQVRLVLALHVCCVCECV